MSLKSKIEFEPVRTLSATLALGAAVLIALQYAMSWSGDAVVLISGVWNAFIALVGTFFVRNQVTPNASVDQVVGEKILDFAVAFAPKETAAGNQGLPAADLNLFNEED
jgi:hypothetical protein